MRIVCSQCNKRQIVREVDGWKGIIRLECGHAEVQRETDHDPRATPQSRDDGPGAGPAHPLR